MGFFSLAFLAILDAVSSGFNGYTSFDNLPGEHVPGLLVTGPHFLFWLCALILQRYSAARFCDSTAASEFPAEVLFSPTAHTSTTRSLDKLRHKNAH